VLTPFERLFVRAQRGQAPLRPMLFIPLFFKFDNVLMAQG